MNNLPSIIIRIPGEESNGAKSTIGAKSISIHYKVDEMLELTRIENGRLNEYNLQRVVKST